MADLKSIKKDEYLFKEGDAPDNMYIVRSGALAVTKTKNNADVIIAEIGAGAIVGEMALFDMQPRSANVKALKDSEVVSLPYKSLEQQLTQLPEWIRAIVRTMNQNLRDANKRIKQLGQAETAESRFPPHLVNKYISILNFVGHKYGEQKTEGLSVPSGTLRKFTIQVFHEPTNKMQSVLKALHKLNYLVVSDLEEGKQSILNLQPEFLFQVVEWWNDQLLKTENEKIHLNIEDAKVLRAIANIALKRAQNKNDKMNLFIEEACLISREETGVQIKSEHFNLFQSKKLISEKKLIQNKVCVELIPLDLKNLAENYVFVESIISELKN